MLNVAFLRQLAAVVAAALLTACVGFSVDQPPRQVNVFYGTNRDVQPAPAYFGIEEKDVSYGIVKVSVPPGHKMGSIERPKTFLGYAIESEKALKHMLLLDNRKLTQAEFVSQMNAALASDVRRKATFVFVHGFNVKFSDAALRTAQIAVDMGLPAVPAFFSWASLGDPVRYTHDSTRAESSIPALEAFLALVAEKSQAQEVYILAHSLGTEPTTKALVSLTKGNPALREKFKLVTLAAPDIDTKIFREQIAPGLAAAGMHINIYASDNDKALMLSVMVNGRTRVGLAGKELFVWKGMETVDASRIDTDFLGHSTYGNDRALLTDMELFYKGKRAADRPGLSPAGPYWFFR